MNGALGNLLQFVIIAGALAFLLRNTKSFWRLRSKVRPAADLPAAGSSEAVDLYWRPG